MENLHVYHDLGAERRRGEWCSISEKTNRECERERTAALFDDISTVKFLLRYLLPVIYRLYCENELTNVVIYVILIITFAIFFQFNIESH